MKLELETLFFFYGYPFALETLVLEAAGSSKGVPARFP